MPKETAAILPTLNDLLQLDHDAIASYQVAIDALSAEPLKRSLRGFRREHQRHVRELEKLVHGMGGTPVKAPHLSTGMLKLAVQGLGAAGGDRAVLLAFRTNEWESAHKYGRAAKRRAPAEVKDVLRRGAADEAKHYRWAAETLERMGAADDTVVGRIEKVMERVHGSAALGLEAIERLMASLGAAARGAVSRSDQPPARKKKVSRPTKRSASK